MLHVLMVSNHWGAKKKSLAAGVFVDRQMDSLRRAGVKISTFDVGTSHSIFHVLTKWLQLRRTVHELRPDLIHAQYGTIVGFLSVFAGRPAIISFCGGDLIPSAPSVPLLRMNAGFLLSNLAALRARGVICKSKELRQALWWRRSHAVVIPNGVDLTVFSPGSQDTARKELGWELSPPIVLFSAGGDQRNKGLDVVKAAMKVVHYSLPDALLHIVSHNVEPNRMPLYYRAADALVCASRLEGSPNVVKEALACNLPIVSTQVGDVPERLAGVQQSALVARDACAIGEALVKILLERKRSDGREHIACLDSKNIAQRIFDVYRRTLSERLDYNPAGSLR
jgi:teichuronic acid biosynthesis glycosyltransferase TuaC